jgi:hypothetical protein
MFLYSGTGLRFAAAFREDNTLEALEWMTLSGVFFLLGAANVWKAPLWSMGLYGLAALMSFLARNSIADGWAFAAIGLFLVYEAWKAYQEMQTDEAWKTELQAFIRSHRPLFTATGSSEPDTSFYGKLALARNSGNGPIPKKSDDEHRRLMQHLANEKQDQAVRDRKSNSQLWPQSELQLVDVSDPSKAK